MQKVKSIAVVTISTGIVQLTDKQASKRAAQIKATDKNGIFEIESPIQFKAGEVFGVEVTKAIYPFVEIIKARAVKAAKDEASVD